MNSHEAIFFYSRPLPSGDARLRLDLFPAIPSSYGPVHEALVSQFRLQETHEVTALVTLRAEATLHDVLNFLGCTWQEALNRWPELSAMEAYRREHGTDAYKCVEPWIEFYQLLADQVLPTRIELTATEQP